MDETREKSVRDVAAALWRGLRPAVPAVIGAAALTFLFAAVMPLAWVAAISWNLYLDRLSDLFVPPVGNGGRLALAVGMTAIAALLAGLIALVLAKPVVKGNGAMNRRVAARAKKQADADAEVALPRRRADMHPDDAPRPPIRAGRDLPEGGLGPLVAPATIDAGNELDLAEMDMAMPADEADELVLADLAPVDYAEHSAEAPWLQPAELSGPVMPDPADNSLGAMVARFEAGLAQRRRAAAAAPAIAALPTAVPANEDSEPAIDFALEAALSTLQRMTHRAVG
jgi:hypothetical protein